jgi:glycosyltransferase involved in cell wall biosynthesis
MKGSRTCRAVCLTDSGVADRAAALAQQSLGCAPAVLSFRRLRREPWLALRLPFRRLDVALAYLADLDAPLYRDFIVAYLWLLRARYKALRDVQGREVVVDAARGLRALRRCLGDLAAGPAVYLRTRWTARLLAGERLGHRAPAGAPRRVAYLRANLWQESAAGGAAAHTLGVLTGLREAGFDVAYVGTAPFVPAERLRLETHVVAPRLAGLQNLPDLSFAAYSHALTRHVHPLLRRDPPAFLYQRYSVLNASGAELARHLARPFVLEYNGSEVWVARHWGTRLRFEQLAERVELANLHAADLIVVVSRALEAELRDRGVRSDKILVNPNGVDAERFHPGLDGAAARRRLGLGDALVVGFVGTFGPWHGAEVLARAMGPVLRAVPAVRFLLVGDGSRMAAVREIVAAAGLEGAVAFTGLVPQTDAPDYLAACDLLVSPHVPNADGSRFFGSPTKLFEYMAMGKGIVASDLEQIGEVLTHDRTARLVRPGDVTELARGIIELATDEPLRRRLGAAARAEALARYTWAAHVRRLLDRMQALALIEPLREQA